MPKDWIGFLNDLFYDRSYIASPARNARGSSLGLDNSRSDLFNPISELLLLGDLQAYRAAVPTHRRITSDSEITRDLRQRPVAASLHQIHRDLPCLILLSPYPAEDIVVLRMVLP